MLWGDWSAQDVGDVVSQTLEPLLLAPSLRCPQIGAEERLSTTSMFPKNYCNGVYLWGKIFMEMDKNSEHKSDRR